MASSKKSSIERGTVIAVPLDDGRWTACQILGSSGDRPLVVDLHWIGDEPPTLERLREAPLLRIDHHNWNGHVSARHVESAPPPSHWRVLGTLPVREIESSAFGAWGGVGSQIRLQARWDRLPENVRRAYKTGNGASVVRVAESEVRWSDLEQMPRLTELALAGRGEGLLDWLHSHPLVGKLSWTGHGRDAIDLRETNLLEVHVEVVAPLVLTLPRDVSELRVSGDASLLTVVHPGDGRALSLTLLRESRDSQLPVQGLPALRTLEIVNASSVVVAPLRAHADLRHLKLHGDVVRVPDVERLADLRELRVLELFHCYGVDAARMPVAAEAWPHLERASVDGHRRADAARFQACFAGVAHVELRGGKTDAWLAANLDNPFREWTDRSAALGRAATTAWRKARTALGKDVSKKEAQSILRAMIETFNALDEKHDLDTVDREEVGDAFFGLATIAGVPAADAEAWFDRWRDF
ncbi:MAG: hypothetical protein ACXVEE_32460 [Polyangiales bacterium]